MNMWLLIVSLFAFIIAYHRPDHLERTIECQNNLSLFSLNSLSSPRLEHRTVFRFVTSPCNLAEASFVLLSCLDWKLQKQSSPGMKPMAVCHGCGPCFYNLIFKIRNFVLGNCSLVLSFQATGVALTRSRTQYSFLNFWPTDQDCVLDSQLVWTAGRRDNWRPTENQTLIIQLVA